MPTLRSLQIKVLSLLLAYFTLISKYQNEYEYPSPISLFTGFFFSPLPPPIQLTLTFPLPPSASALPFIAAIRLALPAKDAIFDSVVVVVVVIVDVAITVDS